MLPIFMFICYGCYYPEFTELCTRFNYACSTTTPYTHAQDLLKSVDVVTTNCMNQEAILTQIAEKHRHFAGGGETVKYDQPLTKIT